MHLNHLAAYLARLVRLEGDVTVVGRLAQALELKETREELRATGGVTVM